QPDGQEHERPDEGGGGHHVTALAYPLLERSGIDPMAKRPDEPGQGEGSACAS
ncbi:hypothetical protein ACLBVB_29030, partial [Pseudomonas aeruginosa]|uniref:hypothetical protein n=1 Tax=Pseudomonas aeruginosa TaxID=287 RepID=UPI003968C6BC